MRKGISNNVVAVLCLFALFGCKSKKHLVNVNRPDTGVIETAVTPTTANGSTATDEASIAAEKFKVDKLAAIRSRQVNFNTFSGKAQAKLNLNGDSHDVTMNIRIKKGQKIWVSVTALLGIEAARALITPDSIKIMNKLQSTYLAKPFSYVYSYTSRQINYQTLESLLLGNAIPELVSNDASLKPDNGNVVISGKLGELVYQLIVGADLKVSQTSMSNPSAGQSLQVNNNTFVKATDRIIPSEISINSTAQQRKIQVDLHYNKAEFDQPVDFPFSVPGRFSVIK